MPGSKDLEAGAARVQVGYAELADGGQVSYEGGDPTLVQALHAWFQRRQLGEM